NAPAQALEFSRVAEKLDDFLQILLRLVDAGDILEGDAPVRLGEKLGARLAETERLAAGPLHLPREENPHPDQSDERQPRDQERDEPRDVVLLRARGDRDPFAVQALDQRRIVRCVSLKAASVRKGAVDLRPLNEDIADVTLVDLVQKLGERDFLR